MTYLEAGIIVVGGGAAGMCAALRAKISEDTAVVLLEAASALGGNSAFAPIPRAEDYDLPAEVLEEKYLKRMEQDRWESDARIVSTVINRSGAAVHWLHEQIGKFSGSLVERLATACEKKGITVMTDTRVQSLIRDGRGWHCGVTAIRDGESVVISGKAVVLACGGFLGAEDLMQKYYPLYDGSFEAEVKLLGNRATGDGVRMALAAGAGDDCKATFSVGHNRTPFFDGTLGPVAAKLVNSTVTPECLWVNNVGVRFTNEAAPDSYNAVYRQPNKEFYAIYDAGMLEQLAKKDPEISLDALNREMEALIAADEAIVTPDLSALTAWVRGKTHIIYHTIERYNECCAVRKDFLFGKDAAYLLPFGKPPFYGFRLGLSLRGTHGPVRTNPMMAVVDRFDAPVPALIACGADVAGMYCGGFTKESGADSVVFAITTGMIAGDHAAGFLQGMGPAAPCIFPRFSAKQVLAGEYYNVGTAPDNFRVIGGIRTRNADGSITLTHAAESPDRQGLQGPIDTGK